MRHPLSKTPVCMALHSLLLALFAHPALAQEGAAPRFYEEITIVGSQQTASRIAGSAHYIGPDQLEKFAYSDIQRIAREIPGVSIQMEDGFGLRPNISIRGVTTERSSRITLLEDNVLIAPAPYAAPAAYYFPTAGRMNAFEVVKGPSAITQGPYTIGGALNMVSTPIPAAMGGNVLLEGGEDTTFRLHGSYGGVLDNGFGFLMEAHQWSSDGYQDIDRSDRNTGLDIGDYTLKLAYAPDGSRHELELKLQATDQQSNQSYLGLTDADFEEDAWRRYGLSELDRIETEHRQQLLRYAFRATDALRLTVTAYNNDHQRNWYKTEGIDLDGSGDADSLQRTSWANIIQDINLGRSRNGFSPQQLQAILDGELDTAFGSIDVRANNREYYSRGVQLGLKWDGATGRMLHALDAGIRYHADEEDRLQYDSSYQQVAGSLVLNDTGELGAAGNRVVEGKALAMYLHDEILLGNWVFTPGLRYEQIELNRFDYSGGQARTSVNRRGNEVEVWLPGLGVSYLINAEWTVLAGVHKGFSAPSSSPGANQEEAVNYEFGVRYNSDRLSAEAIGFLSDYENILGICTASSGINCEIGDAFNGDAATVAGVEFLLRVDLSGSDSFSLPLSLSYTYTDSKFDTDIASTEFFGNVSRGDPIPYIPANQARLGLGFETPAWGFNLSASYLDSVCVRASCGVFEKTDESLTLDLSANYRVTDAINLFARVENLSREMAILGRQPYGARPNKDRTAALGVRLSF